MSATSSRSSSRGVPIYADYGVSGGYSILREHSLPPLNLTVPESLAVLAGLGLLETSPYGAAARRARAKVLAISREDQLAPVDEALASMFVIDAQSPSEAAISLIPEAIAAGRVVRLDYVSEDDSAARVTPKPGSVALHRSDRGHPLSRHVSTSLRGVRS